MTVIKIPAKDFLYIARFASTEQTRHYLNGVLVESHGDHALLVATDGHRLGILRLSPDDTTGEFPTDMEPVTIPNDKELLAAAKGKDRMIRVDTEKQTITIYQSGEIGARVAITFDMCDMGQFPDWRRVVPSGELSGDTVGYAYSAAYVHSFRPDGKTKAVQVTPNGNMPALVTTNDERFVGVIMPIRHDKYVAMDRLQEVIAQ